LSRLDMAQIYPFRTFLRTVAISAPTAHGLNCSENLISGRGAFPGLGNAG